MKSVGVFFEQIVSAFFLFLLVFGVCIYIFYEIYGYVWIWLIAFAAVFFVYNLLFLIYGYFLKLSKQIWHWYMLTGSIVICLASLASIFVMPLIKPWGMWVVVLALICGFFGSKTERKSMQSGAQGGSAVFIMIFGIVFFSLLPDGLEFLILPVAAFCFGFGFFAIAIYSYRNLKSL